MRGLLAFLLALAAPPAEAAGVKIGLSLPT